MVWNESIHDVLHVFISAVVIFHQWLVYDATVLISSLERSNCDDARLCQLSFPPPPSFPLSPRPSPLLRREWVDALLLVHQLSVMRGERRVMERCDLTPLRLCGTRKLTVCDSFLVVVSRCPRRAEADTCTPPGC